MCNRGSDLSSQAQGKCHSEVVKPRPIAEELNRVERIGVSERVECSDWATPIVQPRMAP